MNLLKAQTETFHDVEDIKAEVLRRYLITKEGATLYAYTRNLNRFFDWCKDNDHDIIRPDIVASYKIDLMSRDYKANTINTYLAPLRDFFEWCFDLGYMPSNIGKGIKNEIKQDIDRARALETIEVAALFEATNKDTTRNRHVGLSVKLLFILGLRVSEVTKIKVSDIDGLKALIKINGKGKKIRTLGLNDSILEDVREHISHFNLCDSDYLIGSAKSKRGVPVSTQHVARTLKEVCKLAGIDHTTVKSHCGRVSAINFLLDSDVPIRDVANFAGHKDTATTMVYDRKSQDRVVQTCNIIDYTGK